MVARGSVTDQGRGGGWGARNAAAVVLYNKVMHHAGQQTTKQTLPYFQKSGFNASFSVSDSTELPLLQSAKDAVWSEMTLCVCVCVCVCVFALW